MQKWLFLFCYIMLLKSPFLYGQADTVLSPYNPKGNYQTWAIKGVILPIPVGNQISTLGGLGLEYGFWKNHSIGIEGIIFYTFGSRDKVDDTAGVFHDVGAVYHSFNRALFLNYRYYFNFAKLREKKGLVLYTGAFSRYGKISEDKDPLFPAAYITNKETHYSAGILIGSIYQFPKSRLLGLDVNIGLFYKEKYTTTEYLENNSIMTKSGNAQFWGMRVGINLYLWFCRPSCKKTSSATLLKKP